MTDNNRGPGPSVGSYDWQLDAACRGMESDAFFHPWGESRTSRKIRITQAKAVCATCPALEACRAHALDTREPYGIWGGLSEDERAQILQVASLRYPAPRTKNRRPTPTTQNPAASRPAAPPAADQQTARRRDAGGQGEHLVIASNL